MILITGGLGYIGSHIAATLMLQGHAVVLVDNFSHSRHEILVRLERLTGQPVNFQRLDIRNTPALQRVFDEFPIQAVIHCAGMKANMESILQPLDHYNDNVGGLISVLRAMQRSGVKTLTYTSTAAVYGEAENLPVDEESTVSPITPYANSVLMCEDILRDFAIAEPDWRIAVLRCFNVAGAHKSGVIGEWPSVMVNNLVSQLGRVVKGERTALEVYGDAFKTTDGTIERDYVHIMDVVEAHLLSLDWLFNQAHAFGVFNIATGTATSIKEMVKAFALASDQVLETEVLDARTDEVPSLYADITLAKAELKWEPKLTLADIVEDSIRFGQGI